MPSRATLIATVLGLVVAAVDLTLRSIYTGWYSNAFMVVDIVLSTFSFAMASILFYHTFHQLRLASQIQRLAARLDLFQFAPLYAFSGLTARTGLVLIFLVSLSVIGNPNALDNPILLALHALGLVLATACFVLPLYGIHQRIMEEKQHLLGEANKHLQATIAELHRKVQERDWSQTEGLNNIMAGLVIEREFISKIPTWPWQPGTFPGFVTALTFPIVIFLIQTALKRLLNL